MGELQFRTATTADIYSLHRLVESAYRGTSAKAGWTNEADLLEGQRTDTQELAVIIADPAQRLVMGYLDGQLAGCVCVASKGEGLAYLGMLTVDPSRQASGLGKQFMKAAEDQAIKVFGANRMEMTVIAQRPELIAYYERRGYVLKDETRAFPLDDPRFGRALRDDLYFVVMEKALA